MSERYTGVIIGLDLAGGTGVAEGCAGQAPLLSHWGLRRDEDNLLEVCALGGKKLIERISAERFIGDRFFARGEAASEGLVRVVIEAPIEVPIKNRNNHSHSMSLGLFAALGSLAMMRGVRVHKVNVKTARKLFIGRGDYPGDLAKRSARMMAEALGWKVPSLDAADAAAVWYWGSWQWHADVTPPTKPLFSRVAWDP